MSTKIYIEKCKKETEEFQKRWDANPCNTCQSAWENCTKGKDEEGEYVKFTSCKDNCIKYDSWSYSL